MVNIRNIYKLPLKEKKIQMADTYIIEQASGGREGYSIRSVSSIVRKDCQGRPEPLPPIRTVSINRAAGCSAVRPLQGLEMATGGAMT